MSMSAAHVCIREPHVADAAVLKDLMEQLGYSISVEAMQANILNYAFGIQKAWVAEVAGKVVGCIAVTLTDYFHKEGTFLRVITMVVDQHQRRNGIGKHLMQFVEDYAVAMQCKQIELTSNVRRAKLGSHAFYQALGYEEVNLQQKYFVKKLNAAAQAAVDR